MFKTCIRVFGNFWPSSRGMFYFVLWHALNFESSVATQERYVASWHMLGHNEHWTQENIQEAYAVAWTLLAHSVHIIFKIIGWNSRAPCNSMKYVWATIHIEFVVFACLFCSNMCNFPLIILFSLFLFMFV